MRILVAHNVGRARTGGMSRIMGFIHDEIAARGHTIDWICADDLPEGLRGSRDRFTFPWFVWRAARAAAASSRPYDVVNVHEPQGALAALDARRISRYGVVVTSHGVEQRAWQLALEERRLGRGGPTLRSRVLYPATGLWQSRLALSRARLVLALNEEDRDYLQQEMGIPGDRIRRMRPGASLAFAAPAAARSYASGQRLVFCGTWRHNKGIADLVPAFASLAGRHPGLTLTVVGAGVDPDVVAAAFPPAVRDRVRTHPAVGDEESIAALASADVFLLPSLFEGTPLTLIEAMMSGLPIVTTATCGMKDVIEDGVTGLLVAIRNPQALADAVERLIADAGLRERLGRRAHAVARDSFTWPRVADDVLDAYLGLAAERA